MANPLSPAEGLKLLSEAVEESLDELFDRDPRKATEADFLRIIEKYRVMRTKWMAAEMIGKKSLPKEKKPTPTPKPKVNAAEVEF